MDKTLSGGGGREFNSRHPDQLICDMQEKLPRERRAVAQQTFEARK